jgi:hypothetical protein
MAAYISGPIPRVSFTSLPNFPEIPELCVPVLNTCTRPSQFVLFRAAENRNCREVPITKAGHDPGFARKTMNSLLLGCCLLALGNLGPGDELAFVEPKFQAGKVYAGVPLSHRFEFQNTSAKVIRITDVHTHCGCTTSKLPKLEYQPGERGSIDMDVLTLTQPAGLHSFTTHLTYEVGGTSKEIELSTHVDLVSELMLSPAKLVVPASHVERHPFTLRDSRETPVQIVEVRTSLPHLSARASEPQRDASGGWTRSIQLVVEPGLAPGKHEARLDIYTNDPRYQHLQAPFVLVNRSDDEISFSPREIEIRGQADRALPSKIVVIRPTPKRAVQVEAIKADNPAITTRWAANADGVVAVRVQVDAKKLNGNTLDSFIYVKLGGPTPETIEIPVHCKVGE